MDNKYHEFVRFKELKVGDLFNYKNKAWRKATLGAHVINRDSHGRIYLEHWTFFFGNKIVMTLAPIVNAEIIIERESND